MVRAEQDVGMTMQLHRLPKHDIHPERYARRLNIEEDAPELVPLHLGLGTHYTWVYAGTPPQRASVIADTGSGLMAFPCSGCDGCGSHTDQPFQADNSSTLIHVTCAQKSFFQCRECKLQSDTCDISQSYMEGSSWKASVVEDVVYLGGESSFQDEDMRNRYGTHFQFGCQSSEKGLFVTQVADGIMGLSNTENHIVAKLHRENKISSNLFSLCFTDNGGTMSVGHPHKAAHRGEISYAKVISDRSAGHFYNVNMKDIRIGGKSINAKEEAYSRGHYIVDSGTTDSYLPRALKTEFLQVFKEVTGRDYQVGSTCKGFTNEDLASLPTIQLVMEAYGDENAEVILDVPPEQYLLESNGAYCGGIYLSENSGGVIGANLMMNRDVVFDLGNQRVGFVDADCAFQGGANATAPPSIHKGATSPTSGSEVKENNIVPTATNAVAPTATQAAVNTVAPTAAATLKPTAAPAVVDTVAPIAAATSEPTESTVVIWKTPQPTYSEPVATASSEVETTPEPTAAVTTAPAATQMTTNASALNAASTTDQIIQPLSDETTTTAQSSSAATGDQYLKEKESSGAHPMVLTIVGAVLVVGFLVMMLISVSRRKQKTGKEQLWSRVKGDEEDEDDDDEEEFGVVRNDKKKSAPTSKHQRLDQDDDDDDQSSSDEEDEVFDRKSVQETKVDNRTLERL
ncbi:Aspartyl protease AED3 [Phytophthora citrophthora]|uniref:Aspartyl protease AED3 n=1 Tax=Phytophthora citrophthora TaxID=4793 RepID=A0AAD9LUE1_9STRA|nr:Aspartyl protease AED3 [Phytophthora citrophthora]